MDEKSDIEIRGEVNLTFQDFLYEINLWTLISNKKNTDVLRKIVDAYYYSDSIKLPRILIVGAEGKTTTAHALINSLAIERITFVESKYLDNPGFSVSSKYVFENGVDKAVIIGNIEGLSRTAESNLWQYLSESKCCYGKIQHGEWEIVHYDGILILTTSKKELVSKQILNNIDVVIELEPYESHQIRQILEQRLKYMKIIYDQKSFNLLLNSSDKLEKLMRLLKLGVISMMCQDRNELLVSDIEWALENLR